MTEKYSKDELSLIRARITTIIDKCEAGHKLNFARRIKHSSGNIESWLNPKYGTVPSFKALRNIANEYKINLNWLVSGSGPMYQFEVEKPDRKIELEVERLKGELSAFEKIIGKIRK